jgi:RHS repeat-associated protein
MTLCSTVRRLLVLVSTLALAILPTAAIDEPLRALRSAKIGVETGPQPDIDLEAPPSAYPLKPVEQLAFRGARHGLVNTTTGTIAFQNLDLRLPGRMPIEMTRVFDTSISLFMPPPPPQQQTEPRWTYDLGKNWILGYAAYLVPIGGGVVMATPEGDLLWWQEGQGGVFTRQHDVPTKHAKLQRQSSTVIYETQLDGSKWTYTWQTIAGGNAYALTKVEDRSGNTITVTYTQGYISKVQNSDGAYVDVFRPIYDANYPTTIFPRHRVTKLTDSTLRSVQFDYNAAGLLTKVTDARGKDWTFTYSWDDKVATATDPLGNVYLNATYDSQHRVATYEADAGTWTFNYAAGTNQTSVTDAYGKAWIYTRDAGSGITTGVLEPEGGSYQLVLDSARNPISYTGPEGESIAWTYNADHRPLTYRPETSTSAVITYAYNAANGWVDSVTNLSGGQTIYTRDAKGRVTQEQDPAGGKTTATYSDATGSKGDRLTMRLPLGNNPGPSGYLYTFGHDTYGNINSITDPAGRVFETDYDNRGNVWKVRRPDHLNGSTIVNSEWIYLYDAEGRLTSAKDPLNNTWTRTFDDAGRLVAIDGPAGTKRRYTWDAKFRLTGVTVYEDGSNDPTTILTYDNAGRIATKTTPGGGVWNYAYDDSGRRIEVRDPLNRTWTYTRDLSGRITAVGYPGGRTVSIDRYSSGLVQQRTYPHGLVENFTYDSAGRVTLAGMQDTGAGVGGQVEYTYDTMGRPNGLKTTSSYPGASAQRELEFAYDLNGNRVSVTDPTSLGDLNVVFAFDNLDRLVSADRGNTYGKTTVIYDLTSGRRSEVNYRAPSNAVLPNRWDRYLYDVAGRMTGRQWQALDGSETVAWTLDGEGRFTAESTVSGAQRNLVYGFQGLPTQVTSAVSGTTTVTGLMYDAEGLLSQRSETVGSEPASVTSYTWDAARRLNAVYNGLTGVTYTWTDAPASDLGAAFSVWRSQGNAEDRMLDIRYGYDGLLRKILTYHPQEPGEGKVAIENYWAPTESPIAFIARERKPDDTIGTKQYYLDAGGYYGYGNATTLVDPVQLDDNAKTALALWSGAPMPLVDAGFRIDWPNVLRASSGEYGEALNGLASSMPIERDLISGTRQPSPASLASIGYQAAVAPPQVDFSDAWINGTLTRQRQPSDYDVLGLSVAGVSGLSSSEITPDERQEAKISSWMKPKRPEDATEVDLCEGVVWQYGLGDSPVCNVLLSSTWLMWNGGGGCGNGNPDTDTGQSSSLRNPDLSVGGVSLQTGEFVTESTDIAAWDPAGPIPFTRKYRSDVRVEGGLGHRWFHEYDESLRTLPASGCHPARKRWVMSDGNGIDFYRDGENNKYTAGPEAAFQIRYASGRWEIRSVDGTVRRFAAGAADATVQLEEIDEGPRVLKIYRGANGRVSKVTSKLFGSNVETDRLVFDYPLTGAVDLLKSVTADGRTVTFAYNSCRELISVSDPSVQLGYDKTGAAAGSYTPQTIYDYTNPTGASFDCTRSDALAHKLIRVKRSFIDPLVGGTPDTRTVLENAYDLTTTNGAMSNNYYGVSRQYFPRDNPVGALCPRGECAGSEPDISYPVTWVTGVGRRVDVVDHRLKKRGMSQPDSTQPDVATRYDYEGNAKLLSVTVDYGGLASRTEYRYDSQGLRNYVKEPDGRCTWYEYTKVAGSWLVGVQRQQSAAQCALNAYGPEDLVTAYGYEPVRGVVRSITRPEAFLPPDSAAASSPPDMTNPKVRKYSTVYEYDFDQDPANIPALQTYCTDWGFTCPTARGELNDGNPDNTHWFGNRVRSYVYDESGTTPTLIRKQRSQAWGRIVWEQTPDSVSTEYDYYTNLAPAGGANWEWRGAGSAGVTTMGGDGPLARVRVVPKVAGTPLTKRFAYNARGEMVASDDPVGVRIERTLNSRGEITQSVICAPTTNVAQCQLADGNSNPDRVLRVDRESFDLLGRSVRSASHSYASLFTGSGSTDVSKAISWTTYDVRGNATTITVDPRTGLAPGSFKTGAEAGLHLVAKSYYDGFGRTTATRSPDGRVTCSTYDGLGQLMSQKRLDRLATTTSGTTVTHVDADCSVSDTDAVTTSVEYDKGGRVFRATDGRGTHTYSWYDKYGRLAYVSDGQKPGSDAVDPVLWNAGLMPGTPSNWYRQTTYDAVGLPLRQRMRGRDGVNAGQKWLAASWTSYDHLRRPIASYAAVTGATVDDEWDDDEDTKITDPNHDAIAGTELVYQADGTVLYQRQRKAGGGYRESEITYDSFGRVETTLGPTLNGHRDRVDIGYSPTTGQKISITRTYFDPELGTARVEEARPSYDAWGRTVRAAGELGANDAVTTTALDALSRPIETVRRWQDLASYTGYDPQDQVTKLTYDAAGRVLTSVQRLAGGPPEVDATTAFAYSDDGLMESLQDARDKTTTWTYKETISGLDLGGLGRLRRMSYPIEGTQAVVRFDSYDGNGNPLEIRQKAADNGSADAILLEQTFDIFNRLTSRVATLENLTDSGDPTFYGTTSQTFTYDDRGLLVKAVDTSAGVSPADVVAEFTYNVGGMVTEETQYFSGTPVNKRLVTSTYNKEAFREKLKYPVSWDSSGAALDRYTLTYAQDALGRLATITGPTDSLEPAAGSTRATTTLASYRWAGTNLWDRKYDQNGADLRMYDGTRGSPGSMLVDPLGRVTGMRTVDSAAGGEPVVTDLRYGYNRVGDRTWEQRRHEPMTNGFRTRAFIPDQAGRLDELRMGDVTTANLNADDPASMISATPGGNRTGLENWTLDSVGNWTSKITDSGAGESTESFTPNNLNQLVELTGPNGTKTFGFDWLGQMRQNADRDQKFEWDRFGRLTRVWRPGVNPNPDTLIATYRYDALNRRVQKEVPSGPVSTDTTTRFIYDGWKIIEERTTGAGNQYEKVRARYGYGTNLAEVLWMDRDAPRVSGTGALDPVTGVTNDTIELRAYLHADALGSVVAVSDKQRSGGSIDVIERFDYTAYGRRTTHTGKWTCYGTNCSYTTSVEDGPSLASLPIGYTGHYWDRETGLWYARNRYFDDRQGRFLRRDLLGYGDGPNLYQYAQGNPSSRRDPLGLASYPAGPMGPGGSGWNPRNPSDTSGGFGPEGPGGSDPTGGCPGGGPNCYVIRGPGVTPTERDDYERRLREQCSNGTLDPKGDRCQRLDSSVNHIYLTKSESGAITEEMINGLPWDKSQGLSGVIETVTVTAKRPGTVNAGAMSDAARWARIQFRFGNTNYNKCQEWMGCWDKCNDFAVDAFRCGAGVDFPLEDRPLNLRNLLNRLDFSKPVVAELANPSRYTDVLSWSRDPAEIQEGTMVLWYDPPNQHHAGIVTGANDDGEWTVTSASADGITQRGMTFINTQQGTGPIFRNWIGQ